VLGALLPMVTAEVEVPVVVVVAVLSSRRTESGGRSEVW
jgi:hypothetical protein